MKRFLLLFLIVFPWLVSYSQQVAQYNLYHFNLDLINPGATGYLPCKQFNITDRHQWTGIEGAPSIQSLSIQLPRQYHKYRKYALGLNLVRDVNGATQNLGGELLYAFHITMGNIVPKHLGFGLAGKFGQYSFDEREFTDGIYDPIIGRSINTEWYFNVSAGVFFYSEKYYAGIAVYNLVPRNTNYYRDYGNEPYFLTCTGGYHFNSPRKNFRLTTSLYFAGGTNFYQADINNFFYLENGLWTGITFRKYIGDFYRAGQNTLLFLGYITGSWNFAYTYDLGINGLQRNHFGSHQLSVSYTLCRKKYACPAY